MNCVRRNSLVRFPRLIVQSRRCDWVVPDGRKMVWDDLSDGTQSQRQPIAGQMVAALESSATPAHCQNPRLIGVQSSKKLPARLLPFPQALMLKSQQRREKIADDRA